MLRIFGSLLLAATLLSCGTGGKDSKGKTTVDKNKTDKSGPKIVKKKSGELCEGENCPGYIE